MRLFFALLMCSSAAFAAIPQSERDALIRIYHAFPGNDWDWVDEHGTLRPHGTECEWNGVSVVQSPEGEHVTGLYLQYDGSGGQLPTELGNLTQLSSLSIYSDKVFGAIPDSIGQLTQMNQLAIFCPNLEGQMPATLSNLSNLSYFSLRASLTGNIPDLSSAQNLNNIHIEQWQFATLPDWISQLNLLGLTLIDNGLTQIPNLPTTLKNLQISKNKLTSVPYLSSLSQLEHLNLSENEISTFTDMSDLEELVNLILSDNQIVNLPSSDQMPPNISNLVLDHNLISSFPDYTLLNPLSAIYISHNQFTTIPSWFQDSDTLYEVDLSENLLTSIDPNFYSTTISRLDLSGNQISALTDNFSKMSHLSSLSLANNQLSGPWPTQIENLEHLFLLNLSHNQLSGEIPESIKKLENLYNLDLSHNNFTKWPSSLSFPEYARIDVSFNDIETSSCTALLELNGQVKSLDYEIQNYGFLNCMDLEPLAYIPWIANDPQPGEWQTVINLYNHSKEPAELFLLYNNDSFEYVTLTGGFSTSVSPPSSDNGYAAVVYSNNDAIEVSMKTSNANTASKNSPAQTNAIKNKAEAILYPYLPGETPAAVSLFAPHQTEAITVDLELWGETGLVSTKQIQLTGSLAKAFMLEGLFPENRPTHCSLIAKSSVDLVGTAFAFNQFNEPSMSQALVLADGKDSLLIPWVVSDTQWDGRISIVNPNTATVNASLTAVTADGERHETSVAIEAKRLYTASAQELFPQISSYSLAISATGPIHSNFLVFNRELTPDSPSPAQAEAVDIQGLTSRLYLGSTNGATYPAIVLVAPNNEGPLEVLLTPATDGYQLERTILTLQDDQPKALLISDIFENEATSIEVSSLNSTQVIAGTSFAFNQFREPSMSSANALPVYDFNITSVFLNVDCEDQLTLKMSVENLGSASFTGFLPIEVQQNGQTISQYSEWVSLSPQSSINLNIPLITFFQSPLEISVNAQREIKESSHKNNSHSLDFASHLAFMKSSRLQPSDLGQFMGVMFADETELTLNLGHLVMNCGDELTLNTSQLVLNHIGDATSLEAGVTIAWETSDITAILDTDNGQIRLSALEVGHVYKFELSLNAQITQEFYLSKSNYTKAAFFGEETETGIQKVYHPFVTQNLEINSTPIFTADKVTDLSIGDITQSIEHASAFGFINEFILELPRGIYGIGEVSGSIRGEGSLHLKGYHANQTIFLDTEQAGYNPFGQDSTPMMSLYQLNHIKIESLSFWGTDPTKSQVQEVSGQYFELDHTYPITSLKYQSYPNPLLLKECSDIHIKDCEFRYFSRAIYLESNTKKTSEWAVQLENLSLNYGLSGIGLNHTSNVLFKGNNRIFHMSTNGIFVNNGENILVDQVEIDGARHQGMYLDRVQNLRLSNSTISNSGESGIHFNGNVQNVVIEQNIIDGIDRDLPENAFNDSNFKAEGLPLYLPGYEGIKFLQKTSGSHSNILISNNVISNAGEAISLGKSQIENIVIEGNQLEARRRGIRLEFGWSNTFSLRRTIHASLTNLFISNDNTISLIDDPVTDNPGIHANYLPCFQSQESESNISYLESYGQDQNTTLAYYPFPMDFFDVNECQTFSCDDCAIWRSNEAEINDGGVYLPINESFYLHPNALWQPIDDVLEQANSLKEAIDLAVIK